MSEEKIEIAYEILAYLIENPNAKDTLEGIVDWWLLERTIKRHIIEVKESLALLVARGLLLERKGKDGRAYFKVNRRKLGEILSLLKQSPEEEDGFVLDQ